MNLEIDLAQTDFKPNLNNFRSCFPINFVDILKSLKWQALEWIVNISHSRLNKLAFDWGLFDWTLHSQTHCCPPFVFILSNLRHYFSQFVFIQPNRTHFCPQFVSTLPELTHCCPQFVFLRSNSTHCCPQFVFIQPNSTHCCPQFVSALPN